MDRSCPKGEGAGAGAAALEVWPAVETVRCVVGAGATLARWEPQPGVLRSEAASGDDWCFTVSVGIGS